MAFGITRSELQAWKQDVAAGKIAFLTHFWTDERFPGCYTVTKVGCRNLSMLIEWGAQHDLQPHWIHERDHFPHFDLDRKSTRLNSSHVAISYAVFCLKKKKHAAIIRLD